MHLVICHQKGIPLHIGTEDGSEFAGNLFDFIGHVEITFLWAAGLEDDTVEMGISYNYSTIQNERGGVKRITINANMIGGLFRPPV